VFIFFGYKIRQRLSNSIVFDNHFSITHCLGGKSPSFGEKTKEKGVCSRYFEEENEKRCCNSKNISSIAVIFSLEANNSFFPNKETKGEERKDEKDQEDENYGT